MGECWFSIKRPNQSRTPRENISGAAMVIRERRILFDLFLKLDMVFKNGLHTTFEWPATLLDRLIF